MPFLTLMVLLGIVAVLDKLFSAGSTSHMIRRTKTLVSRWGGLVIVLVGLALWFAVPAVTGWLEDKKADDPTGPAWMDWSVFQTLLLSGIRAVALYCFSVLLVRVYMPVIARFWKKHFVRVFYRLTEWQKVIVSFWAVSLFVFICVSLTH
jgi:hypothetical protein